MLVVHGNRLPTSELATGYFILTITIDFNMFSNVSDFNASMLNASICHCLGKV